jgi:hypothetical protein
MNDSRERAAPQMGKQGGQRKPYTPPRLTRFGHVAALTQSSGCSANNDGSNATCQVGLTSMGPKSSDRRLKEHIVRIGEHPAGFGLYLFDYKPAHKDACGHGRQFGVMADEVEAVVPGAVEIDTRGYKVVDYDALGIRATL